MFGHDVGPRTDFIGAEADSPTGLAFRLEHFNRTVLRTILRIGLHPESRERGRSAIWPDELHLNVDLVRVVVVFRRRLDRERGFK